jgi:NCS1 family nucleobase:cation symporter-1
MSLKRLVHKIELTPPEGCVTAIDRQLAGEDLLPVPPHKRQWKAISYLNFWIADSFNGKLGSIPSSTSPNTLIFVQESRADLSCLVNTFAIASSGIVAGLSWWQALIATAVGYSMAAPFLCLNGRPGAVFHIKFPVLARASFGLYLSIYVVVQR